MMSSCTSAILHYVEQFSWPYTPTSESVSLKLGKMTSAGSAGDYMMPARNCINLMNLHLWNPWILSRLHLHWIPGADSRRGAHPARAPSKSWCNLCLRYPVVGAHQLRALPSGWCPRISQTWIRPWTGLQIPLPDNRNYCHHFGWCLLWRTGPTEYNGKWLFKENKN